MNSFSKKAITKILDLKRSLASAGIDDSQFCILLEPLSPLALGIGKEVIFTEIAGIKIVNIIGTEDN